VKKLFPKKKVLTMMIAAVLSVMAFMIVINDSGVLYSSDHAHWRDIFNQPSEETNSSVRQPAASSSDAVSTSDAEPEVIVQHPPAITSLNGTAAQEALDAIAEKYDCSNVSIALIDNGYVSQTYTYGYADVRKKTPINDDTKIRLASLSKVTVAMGAMFAQEDGVFDIDDSLTDILGYRVMNYSYSKTTLTLRNMLTHTATFDDDSSISGRTLQNFLQDRKSYFTSAKPGTPEGWYYSNPGVRAAGGVVEMSVGKTLSVYLDEKLFDPLHADAAFFASRLDDRKNISNLYYYGDSVSHSVKEQLDKVYSDKPGGNMSAYAGGLTVSPKDYAKVICVLLRDGEYDGVQIMKPETIEEMQEVNYKLAETGLANFDQCVMLRHNKSVYNGRELYWHTGAAYGMLAFASYDEKNNQGIVIATNGSNRSTRNEFGVHDVCDEYADYIYTELLKKPR